MMSQMVKSILIVALFFTATYFVFPNNLYPQDTNRFRADILHPKNIEVTPITPVIIRAMIPWLTFSPWIVPNRIGMCASDGDIACYITRGPIALFVLIGTFAAYMWFVMSIMRAAKLRRMRPWGKLLIILIVAWLVMGGTGYIYVQSNHVKALEHINNLLQRLQLASGNKPFPLHVRELSGVLWKEDGFVERDTLQVMDEARAGYVNVEFSDKPLDIAELEDEYCAPNELYPELGGYTNGRDRIDDYLVGCFRHVGVFSDFELENGVGEYFISFLNKDQTIFARLGAKRKVPAEKYSVEMPLFFSYYLGPELISNDKLKVIQENIVVKPRTEIQRKGAKSASEDSVYTNSRLHIELQLPKDWYLPVNENDTGGEFSDCPMLQCTNLFSIGGNVTNLSFDEYYESSRNLKVLSTVKREKLDHLIPNASVFKTFYPAQGDLPARFTYEIFFIQDHIFIHVSSNTDGVEIVLRSMKVLL